MTADATTSGPSPPEMHHSLNLHSQQPSSDANKGPTRGASLWKFATVNVTSAQAEGQKISAVGAMLARLGFDGMAFQEHKLHSARIVDVVARLKHEGWHAALTPAKAGKNDHSFSSGVGIAMAADIAMAAPPSLGRWFQYPQPERFTAQLCDGMVPGGFYFISCYFFSGNGVEVYNKLLLRDVLGWIKTVGRPFIIGADWNMTPQELIDLGELKAFPATIVAPTAWTCNAGKGRAIDYFLVSDTLRGMVKSLSLIHI